MKLEYYMAESGRFGFHLFLKSRLTGSLLLTLITPNSFVIKLIVTKQNVDCSSKYELETWLKSYSPMKICSGDILHYHLKHIPQSSFFNQWQQILNSTNDKVSITLNKWFNIYG